LQSTVGSEYIKRVTLVASPFGSNGENNKGH